MNFLWLYIAFLPTTLAASECTRNAYVFSEEPIDTEIFEGEDGIFNCIFKIAYANGCLWYKDGKPIDIKGSYASIGNQNEGNCSIQIMNSTIINDDGLWACAYTSSSSSDGTTCTRSRFVKYTVLSKPQMPLLKIYYDSVAITNGSLRGLPSTSIHCLSEGGNPVAKLTWRFSTFQPKQENYHTYSYSIGIKGIDLTAISVLRFFHINETLYDQNLYCVAEHKLQNSSVYMNFAKPISGESYFNNSESTTACLAIGAVFLVLIGIGFGALLLHIYQKRDAKKDARIGKKYDCERMINIIKENENDDHVLKQEPVEYTCLTFSDQTKPDVSQQSTRNEICYAELDFKVLNKEYKKI